MAMILSDGEMHTQIGSVHMEFVIGYFLFLVSFIQNYSTICFLLLWTILNHIYDFPLLLLKVIRIMGFFKAFQANS